MVGLTTYFRIANVCWRGDEFGPALHGWPEDLARVAGQFAASSSDGERIMLTRDRYGINKLFYAIRSDATVVAANYLVDLVDRGAPLEAIFSVPAGHFAIIIPGKRSIETRRYASRESRTGRSLADGAAVIRRNLESWFRRLGEAFGDREVCVCLSGGLDSSLIAAFARRHFSRVTAFTYTFASENGSQSEDAEYAARVADFLGMPFELVRATRDDIVGVVEDALVYGQDWRDFNVHCAVVNEILAKGISQWAARRNCDEKPLVMTGDMMNEILADYTPIAFKGREYYALPNLEIEQLRRVLIRGLDSGDREIGVFGHHAIDAVQPYGLVVEDYLSIPAAALGEEGKQRLVREVGSDLLPGFILNRAKVRAQIGTSETPTGILPLFVEEGWTSSWLREAWAARFRASERLLDRFIRGGMYRACTAYPRQEGNQHEYLVG